MEEIVIPSLEDDEDDTFALPSLPRPSFGSPSLSEAETHRQTPSADSFAPRFAPSSLPHRPGLTKTSASYSVGIPTTSSHGFGEERVERPRLTKFGNGSSSSLVTSNASIGSTPGFLGAKKGSLASLKNAFVKAGGGSAPPIPSLDNKFTAGYPALRNPFSRNGYEAPISPTSTSFRPIGKAKTSSSGSPGPAFHGYGERKQSTVTNHSSHRSQGGRSVTSQGSSNFRSDESPVPALPRIPTRATPSRMGRAESDAGSALSGRNLSMGGDELLDGKTPAEEALRVVFRDFREAANEKVARILARPLNTQPVLAAYFEAGVDAVFDTVIASLAYCGRRHARRIIDMLSNWSNGHCEGISANEVRSHLDRLGLQMRVEDAATILAGRKQSSAKYILNRAMLELVKTVPRDAVGEELGRMIEQDAFTAYRNDKLDDHSQFPHRRAVSQLQMELLGELSKTRFLTISDRFTRELSNYASSGQQSKEAEARIEHVLRGIQYLKLRVYPEDDLEMSAEFIQTLANFFGAAHGNTLKCAYAETLIALLHSVVETATAEVNHPIWSRAVALILSRAQTMAAKPRNWNSAFPLVIIALGVSPREVFMQQWQACTDGITLRLKDRASRNVAMNALVRILWIYLNRCSESSTSTRKRLDTLMRMCFISNGGLYPSDLPLEPFIAILHFIMVRQLDYGADFVTELLQVAQSSRGPEAGPNDINQPDRATVLARAISHTLCAIETNTPAVWPDEADFSRFVFAKWSTSGEQLSEDVAGNADVHDFLRQCSPAVTGLVMSCDRAVGQLLLTSDLVTIAAHASSSTDNAIEQITRKHGDVYCTYSNRYESTLRLFGTVLGLIPRCLDPDTIFSQIANIVCRGTFSADPNVCVAACDAMRRLAQIPNHCMSLVTTYQQFVFATRHIWRDTFVGSRLLDSQFARVVSLWLDLLKLLVGHQRLAAANAINLTGPSLTLSITATMLDKVEGCALFLLCSSSTPLRRLASQILSATRDLEGDLRRPSAAFRYSRVSFDRAALSRSSQLYEGSWTEADAASMRNLPWSSSSDRHRLDLAMAKDTQKLMLRVAESDNAKDGLLWLSLLPFFIRRLYEQLPGPAQELRQVIISTTLRLQGYIALIAGLGASRATVGMRGASLSTATRTSADTAMLADHWRCYLSVLCITMPPPLQTPPTPPVQRTKETVILTPDTIGTPAIFHYLNTVLSWEDPRFRDSAVYALGSIGQDLLRSLTEILLGVVRRLADGAKVGTPGATRRQNLQGTLWTALAHAFRLVSPMILDSRSSSHLANLSSMIGFVKITYVMLADRTIKEDYDLQSLRRSFCVVVENLTNALAKLDSSDRFFGEELRGAIFKLCYDWCHVGRRPDVAQARESHALQAAAGSYRGDRDRAQYLEDLQAKTKLLSAAAAEAMAGLCQGKLVSVSEISPATQASDHIVDPLTVLRWIRGMFSSSNSHHHDTGRKALYSLLKFNSGCDHLLDEVLHQASGESEQFSIECSFFGVVAEVVSEGMINLPIEQIICLSLSKLGHPVLDIRMRAFQIAISLCGESQEKSQAAALLPAIGSTAPNIYRQSQKNMAERMARLYADHAFTVLAECTSRLSQLEAPRRQATLTILPPWLSVLDLAVDASLISREQIAAEHQALSHLLYLAIRFGDDHHEELRTIFTAFAGSGHSGNTTALIKFLFEQGGKRKSPDFVSHAQRIAAFLAQSPAGDVIFEEICSFVEPSAMAALPASDVTPSPMTSLANLDSLMSAPTARSHTFSTGQLALLFAGELLPHRLRDAELVKRLPTLLHVALTLSDHPSAGLRDQCQAEVFQVLRAWVCDTSNVPTGDATAIWTTAETKITVLARQRSIAFWKADEAGEAESAFTAPPKMLTFIMKVLGILLPLQPRVRQQWGELALHWATSCPIRQIACRSFQVFRILSPRVNARMVSDVLARLSSTIGSASPEIQAFNQEVLRTFGSITQSLTSSEVRNFPQIFWCSMAALTTPFESEFTEVIELLSLVLDKFNLSDPAVVHQLLAFRPVDWVGPPPHLQGLLLIGLRSSKTAFMTFDLIRRLTSVSLDDLIDAPADRLLHGFVAALPWMLHSTDLGEPNDELAMMALDLAAIADTQNHASFSRLLTSFSRVKFRAKDDFIRQAAALLRDFLPTHALEIISMLLGFVLNTHGWMRERAMQMLKLILQFPEARAPLALHGNELLQPLLRLLSTKLAAQVLDVLDSPATSAYLGEANDSALSGEIFGPVSDSGWSVPKAKELSALTRENITAVFNTCAIETRAASAHYSVVQFADLRTIGPNPSQVSLDLPLSPVGVTENASMGDLVSALHGLGQFFDDSLDSGPSGVPSFTSPKAVLRGHAALPSDSSGRRVRAILARGRNPSITSPTYDTPSHPFNNNYRPHKHRHNTSDTLTSTSSVDSAEERSSTQRYPVSGADSMNSEDVPYINGLPKMARHHQNMSMSSTGSDFATDLDRSENLFSLEEDNGTSANDSSTSIPMSLLSEAHSTPVMVKRGPVVGKMGSGHFFGGLAGIEDPGKTPSPRDQS